jgi:hypothetical protein
VDGALVLTTDLRVLGFGAEIALDASTQVQAFEVDGRRAASRPMARRGRRKLRHAASIGGSGSLP